jgi:anti-sigma-K factor RskA
VSTPRFGDDGPGRDDGVLGRDEAESLLGAYALDALEPDERARVEEHLARDPRLRAEADELREIAGVLALAPDQDGPAPAALWDRIESEVAGDALAARRAARAARRPLVVAWAVAAAASVAAAVLAAQVVSLDGRLDDARREAADVAAAAERARARADAREAELVAGGEREVARVVLLPDGTGYLLTEDLQPLDPARTYQLWAVVGDGDAPLVISAGVLGPAPRVATFTVDAPVEAFVLTVEPAGGVERSESGAYASGELT